MSYLEEHFNQHLSAAYHIKHDEAIQREARNLQPHFAALSEMLNAREDTQNALYSADDFNVMFTAMARENGSLIRSSFIVTDAASFIDYAQNDCSAHYDGEGHSCYPPAAAIDKRQKMGFAQLLRINSDTRITQPVLSLNNDYIHDMDDPDTQQLISALEALYSVTTHDWLHHLSMYVVSNDQVVKANKFAALKEPMRAWNRAMDAPDLGYKQSAYEAWAVLTHAALLKGSVPLSAALNGCVDSFITQAQQKAESIASKTDEADRQAAYQELAYIFHLGVASLRYVAHTDTPTFTPFYSAFDDLLQNKEFGRAMAAVVNCDIAACARDDYKAHLVASNTVTKLFEERPSAQGHREKVDGYTADLFDMMRTHYAPTL
jgi:hypothetical protein|tara:strand:+ start:49011 stop:50138 length:1128 start_codon:yes stop_codon:yes gene_type:complete